MDYGERISYLALEKGIAIVSSDGQEVGKLEHVLADDEEDVFDGIVIHTHLGPGGLHFVDDRRTWEVGEPVEGSTAIVAPRASLL